MQPQVPPSTLLVIVAGCILFALFRSDTHPPACPSAALPVPLLGRMPTPQPGISSLDTVEMSADTDAQLSDKQIVPVSADSFVLPTISDDGKVLTRREEVALLLKDLPALSGRKRRGAKSPPTSIFLRQQVSWGNRATPLDMLTSYNRSSDVDPHTFQRRVAKNITTCRSAPTWKFVEYVPSPFELRWLEAVSSNGLDRQRGQVLKLLTAPQFAHDFEQLLHGIRRYAMPQKAFAGWGMEEQCKRDEGSRGPSGSNKASCGFVGELNASVFSRMKYEYRCWSPPCVEEARDDSTKHGDVHFSFIEPLVGLLRHPGFQSVPERQGLRAGQEISREEQFLMEHKGYMLVDKWAIHHTNKRRRIAPTQGGPRADATNPACSAGGESHEKGQSYFFDLGASTWASGAGAASQPWFYGVSWCMCAPFEHWALWELKPVHPVHVFLQLPAHLAPHYKWFNIPLSTSNSSWHNPINHLLHLTRPSDVVFMKVDYDNSAMEAETIGQILRHEAVSMRIDELFFEHHVQMDVMALVWQIENKTTTYLSDSIRLFQKLRHRGVRAHSWV